MTLREHSEVPLKLFHNTTPIKCREELQTQFYFFFLRKRHKNNKLSSGFHAFEPTKAIIANFFLPKPA